MFVINYLKRNNCFPSFFLGRVLKAYRIVARVSFNRIILWFLYSAAVSPAYIEQWWVLINLSWWWKQLLSIDRLRSAALWSKGIHAWSRTYYQRTAADTAPIYASFISGNRSSQSVKQQLEMYILLLVVLWIAGMLFWSLF